MKTLTAVVLIGCAWVLWMETSKVGDDSPPRWSVMSAFEEKRGCDNRVAESLAIAKAKGREVAGVAMTLITDGIPFTHTLRCLPDTIDPRAK